MSSAGLGSEAIGKQDAIQGKAEKMVPLNTFEASNELLLL